MGRNEKTDLLETMPIPQAVLSLAIPTILSSLVMVLYSMADTYFVGMLGDPVQNAAVTLASPVLLIFNAVNNLFGVGASSMISRSLGIKDEEGARQSSAFGFYGAVLAGLAISLFALILRSPLLNLLGTDNETAGATETYMVWTVYLGTIPSILNVVMAHMVRAEGASLHASIGTMSGCGMNILLDPVFILPWGFNMGAAGAGLATFLSNCGACLYYFVLLFFKRGRTCICVNPRKLRLKRSIVLGICGIGVPSALQNLLNVIGVTLLNNFASGYGTNVVAAMGISNKIYMIPLQVSLGFAQGVMPLIGYNYASGNGKRLKKAFWFTLAFSVAVMSAIATVFFGFSESVVTLFMKNESIVAYGSAFLRVMSLALPPLCLDFIAVIVFQACGLGRRALIFAVLRKATLEIPALLILNTVYPLYGLPWAQVVAEMGMAVAAVVMLRGIFRKIP